MMWNELSLLISALFASLLSLVHQHVFAWTRRSYRASCLRGDVDDLARASHNSEFMFFLETAKLFSCLKRDCIVSSTQGYPPFNRRRRRPRRRLWFRRLFTGFINVFFYFLCQQQLHHALVICILFIFFKLKLGRHKYTKANKYLKLRLLDRCNKWIGHYKHKVTPGIPTLNIIQSTNAIKFLKWVN